MASVVGDIVVRVGANVRDFRNGMRDVGREGARMGENVAKASAVVVAAMTAITASVLAMAKEAAEAGTEIKNLSDVAGVGTTEFQKMAAATASVGVEQDKLSDILKDVNDKFGDYMATGAGPLADFFENIAPLVGVTADQFARLSGPEALQLYVTSLEEASVSQQEMTFYMEALASDATSLIPLLANGGAAMRDLGDEAERAGRVLSEDAIDGAVELNRELKALTETMRMQATAAVLEHKEELLILVSFISDKVLPALSWMVGILVKSAEGWAALGRAARDAVQPLTDAIALMERSGTPEYGAAGTGAPNPFEGPNAITSDEFFGSAAPAASVEERQEDLESYLDDLPPAPTPKVYSGRSGQGGPDADQILEGLVAARQAANEEIEEEEERHAGRVFEIKEESLEEIAEAEAKAAQARYQAYSQAFNDVASLANSENDKLAKIGQAAAQIQIVREGVQSASSAWQKGMQIGGPPLAAAFAAASAAKTAALLSQVGGSGGGGGGSSFGTSASEGPLAVTLQGVSPDELISGASVSDLFERLSEEAGDRGITFVGAS